MLNESLTLERSPSRDRRHEPNERERGREGLALELLRKARQHGLSVTGVGVLEQERSAHAGEKLLARRRGSWDDRRRTGRNRGDDAHIGARDGSARVARELGRELCFFHHNREGPPTT